MPTKNEIDRLAAAIHALRPDWPQRSVLTYIARQQAARPYVDLAIALTAVAVDPTSKTPKRVEEAGPWWAAAQAATGETTPTPGPGRAPRCPVYGHDVYAAPTCPGCRSHHLETGTWPHGTRHHQAPTPEAPDVRLPYRD